MNRRAAAFLLGILLAATGCAPTDPLDRRISAESPVDFDIWQSRHLGALSPLQARRFEKARRELQLFVVTEWQGHPAEEQRARLRDQMHDFTVRDFIVQGHQLANVRLDRLLADQRRLLAMHEEMLRGPETVEGGYRRVRETVAQISRQILDLERDIGENDGVIRELNPAVIPLRVAPKVSS